MQIIIKQKWIDEMISLWWEVIFPGFMSFIISVIMTGSLIGFIALILWFFNQGE